MPELPTLVINAMREPLGNHTDPRMKAIAETYRAALDVLQRVLGPDLLNEVVDNLLGAVNYSGSSLLECVSIRSEELIGAEHRDPSYVTAQIAASETAFLNLRSWAERQLEQHRRNSMQVDPAVESVARERLKLAFDAGPRDVAQLFDDTLKGGTTEQILATARLANVMVSKSFSLSQVTEGESYGRDFHELVKRFDRASKPPLVVAADDILSEVGRALSRMTTNGAMLRKIAEDPGPPDPLAA